MNFIKLIKSMKKLITPKKIKNLAAKALKDKPIWKPSKGKVYLKSLNPGDFFTTHSIVGVLLECDTNAKVVITDSESGQMSGKTIISADTEVIKL